MDNNLNPKKDENIENDEKYYVREVRKVNLAFFLSITRVILYFLCLITIFSDNIVGVSINVFSAYFIWVITIAVNNLIGAPIKQKFKIFEFKYFIAVFVLFLLKIFF